MIVMAIIGTVAFGGCSQNDRIGEQSDAGSKDVQLYITVSRNVVDPEYDVTSLRMLVFDQDKSLIINTKFDPGTVYDPGSKNYLLNATIKNTSAVRVFVIANERSTWNMQGILTYEGVKKLEADYHDKLNDLSNVTAPFLMLASIDQDIPTPPDTKIERSLSLVRNVVKVSLSLKQKLLEMQEALTFKKAVIERVPKQGFLCTGLTYDAARGFTQTKTYDLEAIGSTIDPTFEYSKLNQELTFYIAEHILTDKTKYTRLLITATRNTDGMSEVTYEIPLGNGVEKLYDPVSPLTMEQLTTQDLSAARNTHFVIDATVGISDIATSFKVKEWIEKEIPGEITAPYLNISSMEEDVKITTVTENGSDRVVFDREQFVFLVWTNLSKEDLMLNTTVQRDFDTPVPLGDVFDFTWTVTEANQGFLPNVPTATGRLELSFKNPTKKWAQYKLKVSAKNLSRSIMINTNYLDVLTKEQNVTIKNVNGTLVCEPEQIEFKFMTNYPKETLNYSNDVYLDDSPRKSLIYEIFSTYQWTVTQADPGSLVEAPVTGTLKLQFKKPNTTTVLYKMGVLAKNTKHNFQIRASF